MMAMAMKMPTIKEKRLLFLSSSLVSRFSSSSLIISCFCDCLLNIPSLYGCRAALIAASTLDMTCRLSVASAERVVIRT